MMSMSVHWHGGSGGLVFVGTARSGLWVSGDVLGVTAMRTVAVKAIRPKWMVLDEGYDLTHCVVLTFRDAINTKEGMTEIQKTQE